MALMALREGLLTPSCSVSSVEPDGPSCSLRGRWARMISAPGYHSPHPSHVSAFYLFILRKAFLWSPFSHGYHLPATSSCHLPPPPSVIIYYLSPSSFVICHLSLKILVPGSASPRVTSKSTWISPCHSGLPFLNLLISTLHPVPSRALS